MDLNQLSENAKDAEAFIKLLANKNRLMILCSLLEQELSVSQLNSSIALTQSALSQHLATLRQHKLVTTRRQAKSIYYSIDDPRVKKVIAVLYECFCKSP